MNNNESIQQNKIHDILEKIQTNELTLRPKTYFRLKFCLLVLVLFGVLVGSVFLASFILFGLIAGGHAALIGFGFSGFEVFLLLFPWKLVLLEVLLILILEYLLRSFRFGYKVPVLYLLFGVLVLMCIGAVAVNETSLHALLLREADRHHLPGIVSELYENTRRPPPREEGILRGTITAVSGNAFVVDLDNPIGIGTTTPIRVILKTSKPEETWKVGDRIFIRGTISDEEIDEAFVRSANQPLPFAEEEK